MSEGGEGCDGDKKQRNDWIDKKESKSFGALLHLLPSHHCTNPLNPSTNSERQPQPQQSPSQGGNPRAKHPLIAMSAIGAGLPPPPPSPSSMANRRRYTENDINEPRGESITTSSVVHPYLHQRYSQHQYGGTIKASTTLTGSSSTALINCSTIGNHWESIDLSTQSTSNDSVPIKEEYSAALFQHSSESINKHCEQSPPLNHQQSSRKIQQHRHSAIIINIEGPEAMELPASQEAQTEDKATQQKQKGMAEIIGKYRAKFLQGGLSFIEPFNPDSDSTSQRPREVSDEWRFDRNDDNRDVAGAEEENYWMLEWLQSGWQSATQAVASPFERLPPFSFPHSSNFINFTSSLANRGQANLTTPKISKATYDVFLGGSCGNTVWRSELVIPYLQKRSISYYDPQRPVWSENLIYEEAMAKENSRLFLFVLDPGTINATSFLEIAYFAARKAPKLVVVFLGRHEWSDKAHPLDLPDRIRTCNLLEAILNRHNVPMLTTINEALDCVDEMIIGRKPWTGALATPKQRIPFIRVKARRALAVAKHQLRRGVHFFRKRLALFAAWGSALLFVQAIATIVLHFFLLEAVPLAWIVLPFIAVDYAILFITLAVMRIKKYRRRKHTAKKQQLHLPPMPIPRVNSSTFSSGCGSNFTAFEPATLYRTITSEVSHSPSLSTLKCSKSHADFGQLRLLQSPEAVTATQHQSSAKTVKASGTTASIPQDTPLRIVELNPTLSPPSPSPLSQQEGQRVASAASEVDGARRLSRKERMQMHGCLASPIGYDVFLSCSSASELDWMTQKAIPQLHKSGLSYTSAVMYDLDKELRIPPLHTASHLLYYVPSYRTFLSGMIEIAYFIGHDDWQVTVCIPKEAECLVYLEKGRGEQVDADAIKAIQRRNECYRMAFCYLKDLAQRQQCRVFTNVEDAIRYIAKQNEIDQSASEASGGDTSSNPPPSPKRAALRQILAKQHLVRERTQANLLAHLKAKSISLESNASTLPPPELLLNNTQATR